MIKPLASIEDQVFSQFHRVAGPFRELLRDTRDGAAEMLGTPITRESFLTTMNRRKAMVDDMSAKIRDAAAEQGKKVACGDGCHFCCFQNVQLTIADAAYIVMMAGDDLARISERAEEIMPKVMRVTEAQRFAHTIPCPLLKERSCSVYETRPDVCRAWMSVSRTACQSEWSARKQARRDKAVPVLLEPLQFGEAISGGVELALLRGGLATGRYELSTAIAVMSRPGSLDLWFSGGNPFDGLPEHLNRYNGHGFADTLLDMEGPP